MDNSIVILQPLELVANHSKYRLPCLTNRGFRGPPGAFSSKRHATRQRFMLEASSSSFVDRRFVVFLHAWDKWLHPC